MENRPVADYSSWAAARGAWIADKATARRYRFPCPACAEAVEASHDRVPALAGAGGLCPRCAAAEQALYRTTTHDDLLHEG